MSISNAGIVKSNPIYDLNNAIDEAIFTEQYTTRSTQEGPCRWPIYLERLHDELSHVGARSLVVVYRISHVVVLASEQVKHRQQLYIYMYT